MPLRFGRFACCLAHGAVRRRRSRRARRGGGFQISQPEMTALRKWRRRRGSSLGHPRGESGCATHALERGRRRTFGRRGFLDTSTTILPSARKIDSLAGVADFRQEQKSRTHVSDRLAAGRTRNRVATLTLQLCVEEYAAPREVPLGGVSVETGRCSDSAYVAAELEAPSESLVWGRLASPPSPGRIPIG